ncbi:putative Rab-GTPase-TBC domain containing protein [Leishmania utingensis]|uniref:Rab-GTPase-TBC domain containing protein n=1 Tax=Leishmania utingensis TaxID=653362 RepID=A0AAW3A6R1_9TRYP
MLPAFLERILGYPGVDKTSTSPGVGSDGGIALTPGSGGAKSSTQYRAVTRPYRCSQNNPVLPPGDVAGSAKDGDGDGTSLKSSTVGGGGFNFSKECRSSLMSIGSFIGMGTGQSSVSLVPVSQTSSGALHLNKLAAPTFSSPIATVTYLKQNTAMTKTPAPTTATATTSAALSGEHARRFQETLCADSVDMVLLRELSWQGCPVALRYEAWMFLTGCWTAQSATRQPTVSRRRIEYASYINSSYGIVDWDTVCAMVDRGVDTAVHRSTLKSLEPTAGAPQMAGTPGQTTLTELMAVPSGASSLLHAASLTTGGNTTTVANEVAASPPPLLPQRPHGFQSTSAALEDSRLPLPLNTSGSDAQPPSQLLPHHSVNLLTASSSLGTLPTPPGSSRRASASVGSTDAASASSPSHPQFSAPPRPALEVLRLPNVVPAAAPSAAGGGPGGGLGHQLSASTMLGSKELQTLKQIRKDIPRMSGGHCYLRHPCVQGSIERILFIWSLRHPACGYVQGMNDLVVPFMGVVLGYRFCSTRSVTELHAYTEEILNHLWSASSVPVTQWINEVEADVYWMTSYLLNTIQDNYTSSHAGITTMMRHLAAVVQAADPPLYHCLVNVLQLQFEQFSFRWMNCLLMRELTETQSLRLLDAYLSDEARRWSVTHVYVCAALLLRWGPQLMAFSEDYISALRFLQAPPTEQLSLRDIQDVLSEAFVLQNLYEASLTRLSSTAE